MSVLLSTNNTMLSNKNFFALKMLIAKAYDEELGNLYAEQVRCKTAEDREFFDKAFADMLEDKRFSPNDADILEFLFARGPIKLPGETCRKILRLISDCEKKGYLRPGAGMVRFKDLLLDCYKRNNDLYITFKD